MKSLPLKAENVFVPQSCLWICITIYAIITLLATSTATHGQTLNPVSVVEASVDPGGQISVRVQIIGGSGQIAVDLTLADSNGFAASNTIRYFQANNGVRTHLFQIPSFCNSQTAGWRIFASIPTTGSSRFSDTFVINFDPAELHLGTLESGSRFISSNTPNAQQNTSTFLTTETLYIQGLIRNSGCLAQTQAHSVLLELNGEIISGPFQLPSINSNQEFSIASIFGPFSLNGLTPGEYQLTVRIGGSNQLGNPTVASNTFNVVEPLPDYRIFNAALVTPSLTVTAEQPALEPISGDDLLSIRVGIGNFGGGSGGIAQVGITIHDLTRNTSSETVIKTIIGSLEPDQGATCPQLIELGTDLPGNYRIDFTADPNGLIDEINNDNNLQSIEFSLLDGDLDNDSISNSWEIENGFDANNSGDADADPDLDDTPNWLEFLASLDPRDFSQRITTTMIGNAQLKLSHAIPGVLYQVQRFDEDNVFQDLPDLEFSVEVLEIDFIIELPVDDRPVGIFRLAQSRN